MGYVWGSGVELFGFALEGDGAGVVEVGGGGDVHCLDHMHAGERGWRPAGSFTQRMAYIITLHVGDKI